MYEPASKQPLQRRKMKHRLLDVLVVMVGYILSPLSWWNDLLVNVPLAYLFSLPFSLLDERLFLSSFILGYWLSNLFGLLLLHWGGSSLLRDKRPGISIKWSIVVSLLYSFIMIILVLLGWLAPPTDYLQYLQP